MICLSNLAAKSGVQQNHLSASQLTLLLDLFTLPLFLLNRERILFYANAAGHEQLQKGLIVQLRCGRFHLKATSHDVLKFEETVRNITKAGLSSDDYQNCMTMNNPGNVKISITTLPFVDADGDGTLAAVILTAEEQAEEQGTLRLQHMLELTCAEARVAYQICTGVRLVQVAKHLDVSINTVKTHLASIFSKTRCADQSSLSVMARRLLTPVRNSWTNF